MLTVLHIQPANLYTRMPPNDAVMYLLFRLAGAVSPHVPARIGYWIVGQLGVLLAQVAHSRSAVWSNLAHVLGPEAADAERRRVLCSVYRHQAWNYYDLFRLPALKDDELRSLVTLHGAEHLDSALSRGKGVVAVSIHFGNAEIVAQSCALMGYPILLIVEHLRPERLHRYVCSLRGRRGVRLVDADSFLKPVFRALACNEIVGLAADRDVTNSGKDVEFFGCPARLPDGYARLALRTGAALLPCFATRERNHTFKVYVEPEVSPVRTGDLDSDVEAAVKQVLQVIERYIAKRPGQWVMFQPIWGADGGGGP